MTIEKYRKRLNPLWQEYQHSQRRVEDEEKALGLAKEKISNVVLAQKICQEVAETVQAKAHEQMAGVVTRCLQAVFGKDAYTFKIQFEKRRGRTEARLVFEKGGMILEDPLNECGGGMIDIAAFGLRVACLMMSVPRRRRFIAADEPCKNVNGEAYQSRVGDMIEALAEDLGFQFFIISDDEFLRGIGKVVEL